MPRKNYGFPFLIALFPLIFPLYLFRGIFFGVPVTVPEIFLGVALIFFVFRERIWRKTWWQKYGSLYSNWPLWLFLIAGILGFIFVPQISYMMDGTEFMAKKVALGIFKGWIFAPILYFFMAKFYFHEKPALISVSLKALMAGALFLALHAISQVWTGDFITPDGRASGPFESANYLSLYLGPVFIYAVFQYLEGDSSKLTKIILAFSIIVLFLGLWFTQSYASFLSLIIVFLLGLAIQVYKKSPKKFWQGVFVLAILLIIAAFFQINSEKFLQFIDFSGRSSTSVRLQVYDISLALIRDHALLGIGLGQFEQYYQVVAMDVLGMAPFELNMLHPHNIFFAMWLNMGLLGLISFLWLCKQALSWLFEQDKKGRRIAALMLLVILVHGLFDTPYFKNDLAFQFWLLMAILI